MRTLPLLLLAGCGLFARPEADETNTGQDTHDHSTHSHSAVWPRDTNPPNDTSEWLWECTPDWEAGSDLVGTWDAEVDPAGRLMSLEDYTGCQVVFTHRLNSRTDAYIALLRANVIQDLGGTRHGQPPQPTTLLTDAIDGGEADDDASGAALARGGMAGAYLSKAHNLVADDPGGTWADAFLFDVELGGRFANTRRLSAELDELPNQAMLDVALSGDGEWMVLASLATNLDPDITSGPGVQLFARRNVEGASVTRLLTIGGESSSTEPQLSHTGRFVVFSSEATALVPSDTNGVSDIFLIDRDPDGNGVYEVSSRSVVRISDLADGTEANGPSRAPRISATGRFVVFESNATNLVAGDTNARTDVFLHDRDADEDGVYDEPDGILTERVSLSTAGAEADGHATHPGVSDDGRWVTFAGESVAAPLVAQATGKQVFVRDRQTGTTALVTHDNAGAPALSGSRRPFISRSGRTMVFVTASTTYDAEASEGDLHLGFAENPIWVEPTR